jgi:hypothetical protein
MVLSNFLSRRIAPFQSRIRSVWQFTREGDTTQLERGRGSNLASDMLRTVLGKLSPDPSLTDFINPPLVCAPLCSDQVTWMRLLRELPTLDNICIAVLQKGDESRGVQIPRADVAGGPGGVSTGLDTGKGKGKVAAPVGSNDEVLANDDHSL